jgi:hypothetical protein
VELLPLNVLLVFEQPNMENIALSAEHEAQTATLSRRLGLLDGDAVENTRRGRGAAE